MFVCMYVWVCLLFFHHINTHTLSQPKVNILSLSIFSQDESLKKYEKKEKHNKSKKHKNKNEHFKIER